MRVTGAKKNPNLTSESTPQVITGTTTTDTKAQIHNVFIVDASSSMQGVNTQMLSKV